MPALDALRKRLLPEQAIPAPMLGAACPCPDGRHVWRVARPEDVEVEGRVIRWRLRCERCDAGPDVVQLGLAL